MEENQIPEGWERKSLIQLADYINGFAFKPEHWSKEGLPIIRIEQLKNPDGEYDYCNFKIPEKNTISKGDLIFSWSASLFLRIWSKDTAALNQHLFKVLPFDGVDKFFLKYLLDGSIEELVKNAQGSTMQHITRKELHSFFAILPKTKTEQQSIANILTKTDQAIANTEALIAKYTKIKTGLMQDLLTKGIDENGNIRTEQTHEFKDSPLGRIPKEWECVEIDDLANLKSGGTPSRQNSSFWNGEIPWVKTGEVNYNLIKETEEYITEKGLKMSSTVLFPKGTILMALYGQGKTRGRVSILDIDATTNQACVGFLNLKKVTTNFLFIALTNEYEKLRDLSNDGAQKNLSSSLLKKYFLKIPSDIKEQERIDELFARIDNSIIKEQCSLTKLQSIKTGLMQDLLSGKVRVSMLKIKEKQN